MQREGVAQGIPSAPGYVSGIYIQKLLQLAEHESVPIADLVGAVPGLGTTISANTLDTLEFGYADYLALVKAVLDASNDENIGLKFGAAFGIKDYGILGYAMLSCRDLRQCLQTFQNLGDLFGDVAELEREIIWREDEVSYSCRSHLVDEELRKFELQTALAQFMRLRSFLADPEQFQVTRVSFSFAAPPDAKAYQSLFGAPVEFAAESSALTIPATGMEAPFALANNEAWEACEHQCEILCRSLQASGALTEKVRQIALRSPGGIPDLESIAAMLHISARTLRRRLADEKSSYHDIVVEVREQLARRYLSETSLAIKEVGYLLGYSEVANFQRAFKKRVGLTPGEYRASHQST